MIELKRVTIPEHRHYLLTWIHSLGILLGWPPRRVLKWADRPMKLHGKNIGSLTHRDPLDSVAAAIARHWSDADGLEFLHLKRRIHERITKDDYRCSERADWDLFQTRYRLQLIALELKATLPKPFLPSERRAKRKPGRLNGELKKYADLHFDPQDLVVRSIEEGALSRLQRLLTNGADIEGFGHTNIEGFGHTNFTPLQHAARCRRKDCAKWLLEHGANVNVRSRDGRGITALMLAAENGDEPVAALLLEAGANPNATNEEGSTAIAYAAANSHLNILELLFQHRANIPRDAQAVRHLLVMPTMRERMDIIKAIRERGADFKQGSDLLVLAASNGSAELVSYFLSEGIKPNAASGFGNALVAAAASGNETIVRALLESGADVNAIGFAGKTALEWAKQMNHLRVAKLLRTFARRKQKQRK